MHWSLHFRAGVISSGYLRPDVTHKLRVFVPSWQQNLQAENTARKTGKAMQYISGSQQAKPYFSERESVCIRFVLKKAKTEMAIKSYGPVKKDSLKNN
jgi:hypothetical protein